ncbi:hypothetical protein SASPL_149106 [Salvia splendens]|uniref:Uncharacterized protein n=1 Tax=Salvia splendens TaxID=180675 RepID=A0A8X8Z4Y8_SALSN|nr:hypothetical protein SASPL_149106 [Salvia splendens]
MSAAAAASGSGGMDGDDDKRKKLALPADAPDPFIESSDDADDESAPIEKPKNFKKVIELFCRASQHRRRKSKPDPKSIGKTRTGKIGGASGSQCDHPMAEAVNDEDKKATDEKEENAEKSKGGASGSDQSDQSMPDANLSDDTAHYSKTDACVGVPSLKTRKAYLLEIAKKHSNVQKALEEIAEVERDVAAARDKLAALLHKFDTEELDTDEEEGIDEDNQATEEDADEDNGGKK